MDPAAIAAATQLGLGGIIFVIWVFDNRKISALEAVVKEQVDDKRIMREERTELIRLIRDVTGLLESVKASNADMIARFADALSDVAKRT